MSLTELRERSQIAAAARCNRLLDAWAVLRHTPAIDGANALATQRRDPAAVGGLADDVWTLAHDIGGQTLVPLVEVEALLKERSDHAQPVVQEALDEALADLKAIYGPCATCGGSGEIHFNRTWNNDPQYDESDTCNDCHGRG